ncbi:glycosyl hydrolase family 32 [Microbacterium sp. ARD32]|uniref:glycosyl hydrolase family 32 n=1 Tax=Microbacterium sp. ARD32 TaxID=2962577 RepID=UPI0028824229|nr:glycosyl hydrolase family 32 [Microbacterium sp. ARD32]MDT0157951.1 glycosyl hydrolase family 32 [Microbacterium sp. ARD32]
MAFSLDTHWVWDFWVADDGERFHLFYLRAPRSLGDPELRHRHARIGHATSADLTHWTDHGEVLAPGSGGSFDETSTWTGSVVRGDDGLWRMFYTGASFLAPDANANIEAIGMAFSEDLHTWTKRAGFVLRADPAHYEKLGDTAWPEEAWRDPWVFRDEQEHGWHMLITARGAGGTFTSGGVIGYAWSQDLETWVVKPPLGTQSSRFAHLEVLQTAEIEGETVLVFCGSRHGDGPRSDGAESGVWMVGVDGALDEVCVDDARLIAAAPLYAGRIVRDRSGESVMLAFVGAPGSGHELDGITDPLPITITR